MHNLAICDDDAAVLAALQHMVISYFGGDCRIRTFSGGGTLRGAMSAGYRPEIVLMDIELGAQSGIGLTRQLFPEHSGTEVIFITGYAEYCTDVYEANHIYFLLKPVRPEKLALALNKAVSKLQAAQAASLAVRADGQVRRIRPNDIRYLESLGRRLLAHLGDESISFYGTLSEYTVLLGPDFLQCHKSFLVNMNEISSLQQDSFLLCCGAVVPISRKRYAESKAAFLNFLNRQMGL